MMSWQGARVRLRPINPEDWELFHDNDGDMEAARACDLIYFPRSEEGTRQWAEKKAEEEPEGDSVALVIETLDGELVGSLNAHHCDPRGGSFQYGIALFRPHWRKGYSSEAVLLLLRYFFHELRYEKATAHVYGFNEASIKFQESLGFQLEGRLREQMFTNGRRHDELIYGMLRREFDVLYPSR
ncbi:GNAT family N-acetyltransferase [Paenibacillus pasadenensis]|uniref:GNAT family N-acetyltransferase n=1 Tax=Paenibacillus pasadenensis TaxID=217090 RepID=UPI00203D1419|nr:GNAT family N-acetyltransferase [Paenibacillus pasadenensis]MCM3750256.1 GNAT family N-acetyltransferase [Paenibacillus pasadenensis]